MKYAETDEKDSMHGFDIIFFLVFNAAMAWTLPSGNGSLRQRAAVMARLLAVANAVLVVVLVAVMYAGVANMERKIYASEAKISRLWESWFESVRAIDGAVEEALRTHGQLVASDPANALRVDGMLRAALTGPGFGSLHESSRISRNMLESEIAGHNALVEAYRYRLGFFPFKMLPYSPDGFRLLGK